MENTFVGNIHRQLIIFFSGYQIMFLLRKEHSWNHFLWEYTPVDVGELDWGAQFWSQELGPLG